MTLLRQIQNLLERTYTPTGINLEDFLIGRQRCTELTHLAGPMARDLSVDGRTFLRVINGHLYIAIYYHPWVIQILEQHPPFAELSGKNIRALIVFLEELNHAVHAALRFLEHRLQIESESLMCDLELQAKVDTYLSLKLIGTALRKRRRLTKKHERWLQSCLFKSESFQYQHGVLRYRYRETNRLALRLARHLDQLKPSRRIAFIRQFRPLSFEQKRACIQSL